MYLMSPHRRYKENLGAMDNYIHLCDFCANSIRLVCYSVDIDVDCHAWSGTGAGLVSQTNWKH